MENNNHNDKKMEASLFMLFGSYNVRREDFEWKKNSYMIALSDVPLRFLNDAIRKAMRHHTDFLPTAGQIYELAKKAENESVLANAKALPASFGVTNEQCEKNKVWVEEIISNLSKKTV